MWESVQSENCSKRMHVRPRLNIEETSHGMIKLKQWEVFEADTVMLFLKEVAPQSVAQNHVTCFCVGFKKDVIYLIWNRGPSHAIRTGFKLRQCTTSWARLMPHNIGKKNLNNGISTDCCQTNKQQIGWTLVLKFKVLQETHRTVTPEMAKLVDASMTAMRWCDRIRKARVG